MVMVDRCLRAIINRLKNMLCGSVNMADPEVPPWVPRYCWCDVIRAAWAWSIVWMVWRWVLE